MKEKVENVVLREQIFGDGMRPCYWLLFKKKHISDTIHRNLFYTNLALRDSCYSCQYAQMGRVSDFTIGDAWGVKKRNPEFDDGTGVSLLIPHTEKAKELLPRISHAMEMKSVSVEDYIQGNLLHPSAPHRDMEEFWKDYRERSFSFIIQKYAKNNVLLNIRYIIKRLGRVAKWREKD